LYWPSRGKITELTAEITKLRKEAEQHERDHASYVSYEKKAETLAAEIKGLQADLADLNMLADNLNTNTDPREVRGTAELASRVWPSRHCLPRTVRATLLNRHVPLSRCSLNETSSRHTTIAKRVKSMTFSLSGRSTYYSSFSYFFRPQISRIAAAANMYMARL
jgi:hypothetical protein